MEIQKRNKYSWYVVIISSAIGIFATAYFSQFSMTVKDLSLQSNISEGFLLFTDTIKSLVIMLGMIFSGKIYNLMGSKKLFMFTLLCMAIPQFLLPYTTSISMVIVLKIIQGLSGLMFPIFIIIILGWSNEKNSGFATAIFNGIFYGGAGFGATISGFVIVNWGWQASYWFLGILTLFFGCVWILTVKENPKQLYSKKKEESPNINTSQHPLRSSTPWLLIFILISPTWIVQALSVDIPIWTDSLNYSSEHTGIIMSSLTFGFLFATIFSGKLSDVLASRRQNKALPRIFVMGLGSFLSAISFIVLLLINHDNFVLLYICILFVSFSGAWGLGSFYCILPELFSKEKLTTITGFIGGIGDISLPLAPLVVGVIFGTRGLWTLGWGSCILISIISLFACMLLYKKYKL